MLTYNERAAEVMLHLVNHNAHGYSQPHRAGNGTSEKVRLSDNTVVYVHGGDYDCSEAVRMCYAAVGVLSRNSYMWTGNEHAMLTTNGFVQVALSNLRVGDVLWRSGHTEMVVMVNGRLQQAGFRISEHGTINGTTGDQTGNEATYSALNPARWTRAYRYVGAQPQGAVQQVTKPAANTVPKHKVTVDGWLGRNSISELQNQLHLATDGVISNQYRPNKKYFANLTSVTYGNGGSWTVKQLQKRLNAYGKYGLAEDGVIGKATVTALQRWVRTYCGYKKHTIDGYLGKITAYNVQNALNAGFFAKL